MNVKSNVVHGWVLAMAMAVMGASGVEAHAQADEGEGYRVATVVEGLNRPWSLAFLPDGAMLVTERPGRLRLVVEGELVDEPITGVPDVLATGQGGLLDVSLHPGFADNRLVYLTYSTGQRNANRTVLARGRLSDDRTALREVEVIFRVSQAKPGGQHFGSRLLWLDDGSMLMSIGDGGNPPVRLDGRFIRENAQDRRSHLGKVLRLTDDGKPAPDNPFADEQDAAPEVWSYGHRNIQGMAIDRATGTIWATEHGARGGDELNKLEAGANYGWPEATHSREYTGPAISEHKSLPGMRDPLLVWTPALAPSGLAYYDGDVFGQWKGDLFAGGLVARRIVRIDLDDDHNVVAQHVMKFPHRIRDVRVGPDGLIYVLIDERDGRVLRLEPTGDAAGEGGNG